MPSRREIAAFLLALGGAPLAAGANHVLGAFASEGVHFSIPPGWWIENAPDGGALHLFSPVVQGGVDASALIELPAVADPSVVDERLRAASKRKQTLKGYVERLATRRRTTNGLWYSMLEYEAEVKAVEVVERMAYVSLPRSRYIYVFASVTRLTESKHLPQIETMLNSIVAAG